MTALDRAALHPGYWPWPWRVECGGNRRQKAAAGHVDAAPGAARVVSRRNDRWSVMVVRRDPGQWYLGGTMPASGSLIDRVATGSKLANGMFLTPGGERDEFYCSTVTVAKVQWG